MAAKFSYRKESIPDVSLDQWRSLSSVANEVRQLQPWKTLDDTDLFGLEDPVTKQIGLVSVLGALGEVHAIQLHLPPEGLLFWLQFFRTGKPDRNFVQFKLRMLEAQFTSKAGLTKPDLLVREQLGLTRPTHRTHGYPLFRSHRPRRAPWYVEAEEAYLLELSLSATLEFTERRARGEEPDLIDDGLGVQLPELSIYSPAEGKSGAWTIRRARPPVEQTSGVTPSITDVLDEATIHRLAALPSGNDIWQAGACFIPFPVAEGGRPFYPVAPLVIDEETEMVLETELDGDLRFEPAWSVVRAVAAAAVKRNRLPALVRVATKEAQRALETLRAHCPELRIKFSPQLDMLRSAVASLQSSLQERFECRRRFGAGQTAMNRSHPEHIPGLCQGLSGNVFGIRT
jgi:uncharacterized protein DUF6930